MTRRIHGRDEKGNNVKKGYGWHPPIPRGFAVVNYKDVAPVTVIPDTIDMRSQAPPIRDQGAQGSCTGFSSSSAVTFLLIKQGILTNPPNPNDVRSAEYIYSLTRKTEGTFPADVGASITDTVNTIIQQGSAPEADMPYDQNIYNQLPTPTAYADGLKTKALQYAVIYGNDVDLIDNALAQGYPVLFGITVYSSFESSQAVNQPTGFIPLPTKDVQGNYTEPILGGHALWICGKFLVNGKRWYIVQNSWGLEWGDKGFCYISEDYLKDPRLSSDWHVLKVMS